MAWKFRSIHAWCCRALGFLVLAAAAAASAAQPYPVHIRLAAPTPEIVWRYEYPGSACAPADYADVPVRPFLVNGTLPGTYRVLWFAANSNGYYANETAGADVTPVEITLEHFKRRPGCPRWVRSKPYAGSWPSSYYTGLWMVAPFTEDGTHVYALVHNEFHGEWTGKTRWCAQQEAGIYLPCDYWNIVSAFSTDAGRQFVLHPLRPGWNQPAIALAEPYRPNWNTPPIPQGMVAQSNIIEQDGFAYVLAQQITTSPLVPAKDNGGTCLFRAPVPLAATTVWQGWGGSGNGWIYLPSTYPSAPILPPCAMVLPGVFRFSWSYNPKIKQFVMLGIASDSSYRTTCPAADSSVDNSDEAFIYMTATADLPAGSFTPVTKQTCLLRINWFDRWGQSWPTKTGAAYPSLLDPASPGLQPGGGTDLNFQYSGAHPYLYYTRLNSYHVTRNLNDRDVVRWRLTVEPAKESRWR